jgi:hypothetical protein
MKRLDGRIFGGILLILGGVLLLLQKMLPGFLVFENLPGLYVALGFWIASLVFLFFLLRGEWWAAIPGLTLAGIGSLIAFGEQLGDWGGSVVVGSIGLSFLLIYLIRRDFWWALIPGGVLVSIALGIGIQNGMPSVFFLGLGVTFALVALLGKQVWAWWPAGILAALGVIFLTPLVGLYDYIQAIALILGGLILIYFVFRKR